MFAVSFFDRLALACLLQESGAAGKLDELLCFCYSLGCLSGEKIAIDCCNRILKDQLDRAQQADDPEAALKVQGKIQAIQQDSSDVLAILKQGEAMWRDSDALEACHEDEEEPF